MIYGYCIFLLCYQLSKETLYLCLSLAVLGGRKIVVLILKEHVKVWVWSTSIKIHRRRFGDGLFGVFPHLFFWSKWNCWRRYLTKLCFSKLFCPAVAQNFFSLLQYAHPEGTASHFSVIISEAGCIQYLVE